MIYEIFVRERPTEQFTACPFVPPHVLPSVHLPLEKFTCYFACEKHVELEHLHM